MMFASHNSGGRWLCLLGALGALWALEQLAGREDAGEALHRNALAPDRVDRDAVASGSAPPLRPAVEEARVSASADAPPDDAQEASGDSSAASPESAVEAEGVDDRDDPQIIGSCALELRLVGARTFEPMVTWVELWQLDAPGNAAWTRGDQRVARFRVEREGAQVEGLAEGRYRIVVDGEALGDVWAPSFRVFGALTKVELEVTEPASLVASIELYDSQGRRIQDAEVRLVDERVNCGFNANPPWLAQRERRDGLETLGPRFGGSRRMLYGDALAYHPKRAGPLGFELCTLPNETRNGVASRTFELRHAGSAQVVTVVQGRGAEALEFVGLVITPEDVLDAFELPDGRRASAIGDAFEVVTTAIPRESARTSTPWRDVPISVRSTKAAKHGLSSFAVTFTLETGVPEEVRRLVPSTVREPRAPR